MLKSKYPQPTDNIDYMMSQLEILCQEAHQIKVTGYRIKSKTYEVRNLDKYGAPYFSYKTSSWNEVVDCSLYDNNAALILTAAVAQLNENIKESLGTDCGNAARQAEAKRILLQTYECILYPSEKNCRKLNKIAYEVNGQGNYWAQTGMVLIAILGLICGIVPGVLYINHISKEHGLWGKYSSYGLAANAHDIRYAIGEIDTIDVSSVVGLKIDNPSLTPK